jgi:hypothetical protein
MIQVKQGENAEHYEICLLRRKLMVKVIKEENVKKLIHYPSAPKQIKDSLCRHREEKVLHRNKTKRRRKKYRVSCRRHKKF